MCGKLIRGLGCLAPFILVIVLFSITPCNGVGEDVILNFLKEWRNRMCHPIPRFGFPAIDPLHINHTERHFDNKYLIDFDAKIDDLTLLGLSKLEIKKLKINTLPFLRSSLHISIPMADLLTHLDAGGSLGYLISVAGNGNIKGSLQNLTIDATWNFKASLSAQIRNLDVNIKIGAIDLDLKNLGCDRLTLFAEALVNELGLELLNDAWTLKNKQFIKISETIINKILNKFNVIDILALLDKLKFTAEDPPDDCYQI